jgi:hypothetical protein
MVQQFTVLMCPLGIAIAMFRRSPQTFPDGRAEDMSARLLRWAAGLLSPRRGEWGQAMLGELAHIDGRIRRLRFTLDCVIAALLLPPWGRAAAGVWAMVAVSVGSVGLYASVAIRYGLGLGDWVAAAILVVFLAGYLIAASALLRRPGVAIPGLLGGLFIALTWLAFYGFTFYGVIGTTPTMWEKLAMRIAVPLVVGAAGTLWSRDAVVGRRVARLAAITAGLGLYLYGTLAVAVLGAGGPPEGTDLTARFIVSDRLGNGLVDLLLTTLVTATVGWAGAAVAAHLRHGSPTPAQPGPFIPAVSPDIRREA